MTQKPQFEKCAQVSHLCRSNSDAFLKCGGFVVSVVEVLAPPRRKEVGDAYAVVDHDGKGGLLSSSKSLIIV